jgi:uncharacterized protein
MVRTEGGQREIDLIGERDDGKVLAVEVKLGGRSTGEDVKDLNWLRDGADTLT